MRLKGFKNTFMYTVPTQNLSVSLSRIEGENAPCIAGPFFCLFVDSSILDKDSAQIE